MLDRLNSARVWDHLSTVYISYSYYSCCVLFNCFMFFFRVFLFISNLLSWLLFFYRFIKIMTISFYMVNHLFLLLLHASCFMFYHFLQWCQHDVSMWIQFFKLVHEKFEFFWNWCFVKWQTTWFTLIDEINMCHCHHSYSTWDVTSLVQMRKIQWLWPDLPCCVVLGLVNRTKMLPTCCIAAW